MYRSMSRATDLQKSRRTIPYFFIIIIFALRSASTSSHAIESPANQLPKTRRKYFCPCFVASSKFKQDRSELLRFCCEDDDNYAARSQFGMKSYWDDMYDGMGDFSPDEYSWYYGWEVIKPYILKFVGPPRKTDEPPLSLLVPGCGNDPLLLDLYNSGYTHLTAFDYSHGAIERQRSLLEYLPLGCNADTIQLRVEDARSLPKEWKKSFDAVIEKGALDAIYLSGDGNFEKSVKELARVVQVGGICVSISGVVPEGLRRDCFAKDDWECLRDGSEDLKAGCFVWRKK